MRPEATPSLRENSLSANCSRPWASSKPSSNTTAPASRWNDLSLGQRRDWARFGLLYLRDGVAERGQRILPEGWVDYSARLTPQSANEYGYGAGFWTQRGNSAAARARIAAGFPADSFMAEGSQGQYAIVVPSHDLVIVKLGWAYTPHDDHVAVERLVRETMAALQLEE